MCAAPRGADRKEFPTAEVGIKIPAPIKRLQCETAVHESTRNRTQSSPIAIGAKDHCSVASRCSRNSILRYRGFGVTVAVEKPVFLQRRKNSLDGHRQHLYVCTVVRDGNDCFVGLSIGHAFDSMMPGKYACFAYQRVHARPLRSASRYD